MALISVIVPVYKDEQYIHRCVNSILAQTYSDFELILVDDGSPDSCGIICDEYAVRDDRIHVIHQENGGLSAARNAGIDWVFANSNSQWLTFVDSDDWIHPEMFSTLIEAAEVNKVNVSVCNYAITWGEPPAVQAKAYEISLCTPEVLFTSRHVNAVVAWGKLYARDVFAQIRYPVGKIHEDEFTTYKIIFAEMQIAFVDVNMYFYFQNASGITHSDWSPKRMDAIKALEEQIQFFATNRFNAAYKQTVLCYTWKLRTFLHDIEKWNGPQVEKDKYTNDLRIRQKKAAWRYKRICLKYDRDVYADAFPVLFNIYSGIKSVLLGRNRGSK